VDNAGMNVFVLCTGRCGSMTLVEACKHIRNYSAAHESRTGLLGAERLAFPPDHIEVDNRLSWFLGRLDQAYGADAFYVHLRRDRAATAASYAKRHGKNIMDAYAGKRAILLHLPRGTDAMSIALDLVDTVTANIEAFLKDKPRRMHFEIEQAARDFPRLCEAIGADVDLPAALREFDVRHNAG
jgi:hypothetical protein